MFKPFFVHQYREPGKLPNRQPRGFTVWVTPDQHIKGNILVNTAWCSPKDEFSKKKGREQAMNSWPISMRPQQLPVHLSNCSKNVWGYASPEDAFYYLFKRML